MRKFIFIFSIIFSNLSFSGESIEIFLDDQHKNLFGYIEKNIELIDKDKNLFIAGFEKSIEDLIDPKEISKRVMGKMIYQQSSPAQIERFNLKFKSTLFESYSSALKELNYEDLKIVSHLHPNERMDLAIVKLKINLSGRKIDFIYKMKKINNDWKIIGLILDGIDIISIFRKQFLNLYKVGNMNIDFAINNWNVLEKNNG
ncbi:ABC transporter substrate-binding protein [SAR86 cluster bacterium]|jgi:ABC-type transporter MlaC component|nr:ABC transporter substrate-binding protein [SAR86 cluster bacterium]